jgi:hypothetical protein
VRISQANQTKSYMKRYFILAFLTLILFIVAHTQTVDRSQSEQALAQSNSPDYRLFPTQNIWTFIKLNTRNGQLLQVQYHTEDNKRFESILSSEKRVSADQEKSDRFTLYSTQNIYTFLMLDQVDGRVWQVQWSIEPKNRVVIAIQ